MFDPNETQHHFMVSYELLELLEWLIEHESDAMKKLIVKSLRNGLQEKIMHRAMSNSSTNTEELYSSITDFFLLMEALLAETNTEDAAAQALQRHEVPAVNSVDIRQCGADVVALSAAKASSLARGNATEATKSAFCRELIKRWKPQKKTTAH